MSFLLGNPPSLIEAADGLAITMVLLLGFALGMILTILFVMLRHAGKNSEPDEDHGPPPVKTNHNEDTPQVWEKDPDWWK